MIIINKEQFNEMEKDAVVSFPDECCGFFLGTEDGGKREVKLVIPVDNSREGDRRRKFEIAPKDYIRAEAKAEAAQLSLLGVYHSHPNHPAIPSEHDRVAAQPYFSYIILSVYEGEYRDIRSWRLNDESQFEEEIINQLHLIKQS